MLRKGNPNSGTAYITASAAVFYDSSFQARWVGLEKTALNQVNVILEYGHRGVKLMSLEAQEGPYPYRNSNPHVILRPQHKGVWSSSLTGELLLISFSPLKFLTSPSVVLDSCQELNRINLYLVARPGKKDNRVREFVTKL